MTEGAKTPAPAPWEKSAPLLTGV